jgi:DNA-binding transcriptional MerR regulator
MENLITAGELARLAGTTKRTIIWYSDLGIIKPAKVAPDGYRYYQESQVLEYQMIHLLTTLGITLIEIKDYLTNRGNLNHLFANKHKLLKNQIETFKFNLKSVEKFMKNIQENKTMVKPKIQTLKPFGVYFIEKIGPYVEIGKYCRELASMFERHGKSFTTMAIFENPTYQPKKSQIKIGVITKPDLKIHPKHQNTVKFMEFNPGKVISYTHNGAGELLSLFWKELEKYCRLNKIEVRKDVPDFEIYKKINPLPHKQFFEIYLPII